MFYYMILLYHNFMMSKKAKQKYVEDNTLQVKFIVNMTLDGYTDIKYI